MRGVDVVVLLGVLRHPAGTWTVRMLAGELQLPFASAQRSLRRLGDTPAFDGETRSARLEGCAELFEHALRFVAPAAPGAQARGVPTAWTLPGLARRLRPPVHAPDLVWPMRGGPAVGACLTPLHGVAPRLAGSDPELHRLLALVDAARIAEGDVRRRAAGALAQWVAHCPAASA